MGARHARIQIALVSTASLCTPGSMRAYAETLSAAMAEHAPDFALELVELDPTPATGAWGRRLQTLLMPVRAMTLRRRSPDLWHVLDGSRAYVARALGSAPIVVTVHDVIPWLQAKGRFPGAPSMGAAASSLWRANGREYRRATRLICDSDCTARDARQEFGTQPESAHVVPLPLRPGMAERSKSPSTVPRSDGLVLHIGNNGFYKNREGALRIFARLDPGIARRLVMAGPGPTEHLLQVVLELGLADRVQWSGDPDDDSLAALYRSASVLLFPSVYEGFGWPVLEAMSFGLPVVASNRGSLGEVVSGAADCLPLEDEEGFVAAVTRILTYPEAARLASDRGVERARDFSSAVFAKRMQEAYLAAIEARRSTGAG